MTAGRERFSLRRGLVATQVALCLVLLVGALLFVRSLRNLLTTEAGFKADGVLSVNLDFARAQYPKERRPAVYRELHDRLSALPGVVSAAQVLFTPVSGSGWNNDVGPDGSTAAGSGKDSQFNRVGPGYFRTLGTSLLAGREFDDHDTLGSPKMAIVNEAFARKFFGGANPVGHTFHQEAEAGKPEPLFQIVGLVKNTKYYELREDFMPIGFFPIAQDDDPGPSATFVLRVVGSPSGLMSAAKTAITALSPAIGIEFHSFSAQLQESLLRERLMATLSGFFGVLALLLAWREELSTDLGFHIAAGRWILEHGAWPQVDSFTWTLTGRPYIDMNGLFQVALALAYRGGMVGVSLLRLAFTLASFGVLWLSARQRRVESPALLGIGFALALLTFEGRLLTRPELASGLFLAVQLYLLRRHADTNDRRFLFATVPLQLVWVYSHSLSLLGIALLGLYAVIRGRTVDAAPWLALAGGLGLLAEWPIPSALME